MYPLKQSTAITIPFFLPDSTGAAVTGKVTGDFTKRISKGSGAFAAQTVVITEMENGWYSAALTTAHTDTLGLISLTYIASGALQVNLQFRVSANLPDNLSTDFLDLTDGVETSLTVRQALRLLTAVICGKCSGADTSSVTFRDVNDTANRVVATVGVTGRSAVTLVKT